MNISKEEVLKIAKISRITLLDHEVEDLIKQLSDVLSYAECVKKVAGEMEDRPSNKNVNFFREDVVSKCDSEEILSRAPEREGAYFVVPKILDTK